MEMPEVWLQVPESYSSDEALLQATLQACGWRIGPEGQTEEGIHFQAYSKEEITW